MHQDHNIWLVRKRLTFIYFIALNPGVKRELWQAIPGNTVVNLTSSNEYQNKTPNIIDILTSLEAPIDIGDGYGQKLTTYFLVSIQSNLNIHLLFIY